MLLLSPEAKSGGGRAAEGCSSGSQAASLAAGTRPAGPINAAVSVVHGSMSRLGSACAARTHCQAEKAMFVTLVCGCAS